MRPDSWFLAVESPKDAEGAVEHYLDRLSGSVPTGKRRCFDLGQGRRVVVLCGGPDGAVESARHWLWIVGPRRPGASLKQALVSARSAEEAKRICTSADGDNFAFVVIDKDAGRLYAITDRLNVAKIFHGEVGGLRVLASSMSLFPSEGLTPHLGAVASYVLNGSCLNSHTVFQEITLLERASRHEFREGRHSRETYWHYAPGQTAGGTRWQPAAAATALWELLVQSVARVTEGKRVLLSLSGGYDSGVLLGILGAQLKHPDVTCFSYVHGTPKSGSDAEVAARQAALYGYEHVAVASYSGDLLGMLDGNAAVGQALRSPSYEIEAFSALAERYADAADRVMVFGDECFGWGSYRLNDADDILGAINLKAPALLDGFGAAIGAEQRVRLRAGLEAEYGELRRKTKDFADPDDAKDFLYLDQRLQFNLLPLRTFVAGHWFPMAIPLISPEILDFMAAVPVAYRVDKRLFKLMARRFLPELFGIPRATRGQLHPDFDREIAAARDGLEAAIAARGWKIGGLFTTSALSDLLSDFSSELERKAERSSRKGGIRAGLKKRAKALLANSRFLEDRQRWARRLMYNDFARTPGREVMLLNLLCLADFLADGPPPAPPRAVGESRPRRAEAMVR